MVDDPRAQRLVRREWVEAVNYNCWISFSRNLRAKVYFDLGFGVLVAIETCIVFNQPTLEFWVGFDHVALELVKNGVGPKKVIVRIEETLGKTKLDGSPPRKRFSPWRRVGCVFNTPFLWHRQFDGLGSL